MSSSRHVHREEAKFRVMCVLEDAPVLTTREIAASVGISNGAAFYLRSAKINKGILKSQNFPKPALKAKNAYVLTPAGIAEKYRMTRLLFEKKISEYQDLVVEISKLKSELSSGEESVNERD